MEIVTKIKPSRKIDIVDFRELYRYRDLLYFLSIRGFKAKYAQSVLGIGWAIIQPLFLTLIFTVVFGRIAKMDSEGVPYILFALCGIVPWTYFSGVLTDASGSLLANSNMISKVYFPRIIIPISSSLTKLVDFLISFIVLVATMVVFGAAPDLKILFLPVLFLILLALSISLGTLSAAMSLKYRDIKHMIPFGVQILLYATPVAYPSSAIPEKFRILYAINPMVGIVEGFRSSLLNTRPLPTMELAMSAVISFALLVYSLIYFNKSQKYFADIA